MSDKCSRHDRRRMLEWLESEGKGWVYRCFQTKKRHAGLDIVQSLILLLSYSVQIGPFRYINNIGRFSRTCYS